MILFRILPAAILSLFVTLAASPAKADAARDAQPTPTAPESEGGAAAVYFEKLTETVYIVTREDRRELKADIASGDVREQLEEMADEFVSDAGEAPELLPEEDYEFQLLDIVDVSGWVVVATFQNTDGEVLNVWVSGVESADEAMKALNKHAASKGYRNRMDVDGAYLECDACRVP